MFGVANYDFRLNTTELALLRGSRSVYRVSRDSGLHQDRVAGIFDGDVKNITLETLYKLLRKGLCVNESEWASVVGRLIVLDEHDGSGK